jgi:hypothetical protein
MRLLYVLMFFVLGKDCWTQLLTHKGAWEPYEGIAWCVWTGFSVVAGLGIFHPVKMIPVLLLEVFYKVLWLGLVAYPLWSRGALWGTATGDIAGAILWVPLPIVAIPWGYVVRTYFLGVKKRA